MCITHPVVQTGQGRLLMLLHESNLKLKFSESHNTKECELVSTFDLSPEGAVGSSGAVPGKQVQL